MKNASRRSTAAGRCEALLLRPADPGEVQGVFATSLGNAGVYVTDGETGFLIDPFVSRYCMTRIAVGWPMAPRLDLVSTWYDKVVTHGCQAVLVGHSHYDHAMDAPYFASRAGCQLFGSESTANIGRGAGLSEAAIKVIGNGDVIELGRFRIRFVQGEHGPALFGRIPYPGVITRPLIPPAGARRYRMGGFFGIVVQHPTGTFIHHSSAGWVDGMYEGVQADVFMPCLAGRADTDNYMRHVVDPTGATTVIPIHFDDMFSPLDGSFGFVPGVDFVEFVDTVAATRPHVRVATMPIGGCVRVLPES